MLRKKGEAEPKKRQSIRILTGGDRQKGGEVKKRQRMGVLQGEVRFRKTYDFRKRKGAQLVRLESYDLRYKET